MNSIEDQPQPTNSSDNMLPKRFYSLLLFFATAFASILLIFPMGIGYNIKSILMLVYPSIPFLCLLILYRGDWSSLRTDLQLSYTIPPLLSLLRVFILWNAIFYGGLLLAGVFGFYALDLEQKGLSEWISNALNTFADQNQVPIPLLPFTATQMAQIGLVASIVLPFLFIPFFLIQELVWRRWLPSQYADQSISTLIRINTVWGLWQSPLVLFGLIYSDLLLGIPAIIISSILQGSLLCLEVQKTDTILSSALARGVIFGSLPVVIILHAPGSSTNPLLIGFYGLFSWSILLGILMWRSRKYSS